MKQELLIDFVSANACIQESSLGIHDNQGFDLLDYVLNKGDFEVKKGYIDLFEKSGLCVEINKEKLREGHKIGHNGANPIWRGEDGNFTKW